MHYAADGALYLVVGESNRGLRRRWAEKFSDVPTVNILDQDINGLRGMRGLDCLVLHTILANEWYGGIPSIGEAQLYSTTLFRGWGQPPEIASQYVITGVAFDLDWYNTHSEIERIRANVTGIIARIRKHNDESKDHIIRTLGAIGELLVWEREINGVFEEQIETVREVYLEDLHRSAAH